MKRTSAPQGFSLLEVLVAFVVLSLALVVLAQVFSGGLRRTADMAEYAQALAIAESTLSSAGIEDSYREGDTRGESPDRHYRWTRSVRLWLDPDADPNLKEISRALLYRVEVRVEWQGADGRDRNIAYSTLRVGPRPA